MTQSLGKGLQSLIPKKISRTTSLSMSVDQEKSKKESIFNVEVDKIKPNPCQPRRDIPDVGLKELANSITEFGVLQPLIVAKVEKPTARGQQVEYELIAGERRWRAAKMAGLPHVPVIVKHSSADEKLEIALVENIQREDLNPIEAALAFNQLYEEFGLTHKAIAEKIGKKRTTVSNTMRLLSLPKVMQNAIASGQISEGHGRAILVAMPSARMPLFRTIIKNGFSVSETERRASKIAPVNRPKGRKVSNPFFRKIENDLSDVLGCRVSIFQRGKIGRMNVEFANEKELDKLAKHLLKF